MFTGLVQQVGSVVMLERNGPSARLGVSSKPWATPCRKGESIAIQGVCLTLTRADEHRLYFDLLGETLARTNLGDLEPGDPVNLERSLNYGDPMGGHIVQGHVDDVGRVSWFEKHGQDHIISIDCRAEHLANMVMKGSIGLDGISLTIAGLTDKVFTVHIIPHTWSHTSISNLEIGSAVNIETDVLAKYARRLAETGRLQGEITWETLKNVNEDQH